MFLSELSDVSVCTFKNFGALMVYLAYFQPRLRQRECWEVVMILSLQDVCAILEFPL